MSEFNSLLQEEFQRLRYAELLREAYNHRLVKEALAGQPRRSGLLSRLLYGLGQRLSDWGSRLEARYRCAGELQTVTGNGDCG